MPDECPGAARRFAAVPVLAATLEALAMGKEPGYPYPPCVGPEAA